MGSIGVKPGTKPTPGTTMHIPSFADALCQRRSGSLIRVSLPTDVFHRFACIDRVAVVINHPCAKFTVPSPIKFEAKQTSSTVCRARFSMTTDMGSF